MIIFYRCSLAHHFSQSPVEFKGKSMNYCLLGVADANITSDFRTSMQHLLLGSSLIDEQFNSNELELQLETTAKKIETNIQADKLLAGRRFCLQKCQEDCQTIRSMLIKNRHHQVKSSFKDRLAQLFSFHARVAAYK